jgi:uncharacterized protein YegL
MNRKHIILLLDESGSMESQKANVINGVNETIRMQRELQFEPVTLSIVKFNSVVLKVRSDNLWNVRHFTSVDYLPNGQTALYDAIGSTISRYGDEIGTIMVIVTDGQENSSKEFTKQQMISMINKQRNTKNWNFIYLSEDPTTMRQGDSIGISNSLKNCSNSVVGYQKVGLELGSSTLQTYLKDVSQGATTRNYDDWQQWNNGKPNRFKTCWN